MIRERIEGDPLDDHRFPADPWRLIERYPRPDDLGKLETLFSVGNGYMGFRGNPEEGRDSYFTGTFINGFHETWDIRHAESAYGFAKTGQTMINAPSSTMLKLYVDDEPLLLSVADLQAYERSIDFREGILRRDLVWRTPAGKRVRVRSTRMVSFTERHLALMTFEVTLLDGNAPVAISSQIVNKEDYDEFAGQRTDKRGTADPRKNRSLDHRVLVPQMDWHSPRRMILGYRSANSGMTLAVGADHAITTDNVYEQLDDTTPDMGRKIYRISAQQGKPILITKAVAYHTSRGVPVRELSDRVRRTLDRVREAGFAHYHAEQQDYLADFWRRSDVEVGAEPRVQQAVRWCIFQLAQAAARADGSGVPAKGLTGDGYEGHYFWDTEVYMVPFLTLTSPEQARNALRFRSTHLAQARDRAREVSVKGALFPWRTINGEEASAYYAAGTAQYHIDADVAYAVGHYGAMTGDDEFMFGEGAWLLVESARMWADLGFWRVNAEAVFEIHGVTGPDEYTTVVNNNTYTNVMARWNLRLAARMVRLMRDRDPEAYNRLVHAVGLTDTEVSEWERCACGMRIPFDDRLGIHPQDDAFLLKELWDLENTPPESYPLLLHYHPLVIYRFQVLKQADVVLALFLRSGEFTSEQKRADFEYYDPITTGDSSLSAVMQAIIAAEVGHQQMALDYFYNGLYVDIGDTHQNTADGVHVASAAGTWRALVSGFGGLRDDGDVLSFDPRLPIRWHHLRFPLTYRGSRIRVFLTHRHIRFRLESGEPVIVRVRGTEYTIGDETVEVELENQGVYLPPLASSHPVVGGRRADGTLITAEVPEVPDQDARTEQITAV
ncbi:glycosyl hydrolase family 65 protein [Brooklawnia cerclae]|uniref:Alpha,alpha-trehalose phosphorylase n=1 Tax=Brooklawnia cerclae TaxID=349934 RepID=A0ABX0SB25_9ACTN|nr:alpha,alpha-trehalose phosphorylase [Brooklawnia cerclae]